VTGVRNLATTVVFDQHGMAVIDQVMGIVLDHGMLGQDRTGGKPTSSFMERPAMEWDSAGGKQTPSLKRKSSNIYEKLTGNKPISASDQRINELRANCTQGLTQEGQTRPEEGGALSRPASCLRQLQDRSEAVVRQAKREALSQLDSRLDQLQDGSEAVVRKAKPNENPQDEPASAGQPSGQP
jgi:hypothetical protein